MANTSEIRKQGSVKLDYWPSTNIWEEFIKSDWLFSISNTFFILWLMKSTVDLTIECFDWRVEGIERLMDWRVDWLNEGWLIERLIEWRVDWMKGWLIERLNDWKVDGLKGWMIERLNDRKVEWLIGWMIERLNDWKVDGLMEVNRRPLTFNYTEKQVRCLLRRKVSLFLVSSMEMVTQKLRGNEWMSEWTNRRTDEWMNEWMNWNARVNFCLSLCAWSGEGSINQDKNEIENINQSLSIRRSINQLPRRT